MIISYDGPGRVMMMMIIICYDLGTNDEGIVLVVCAHVCVQNTTKTHTHTRIKRPLLLHAGWTDGSTKLV
jgi:hypothetical protein